MWFDLDSKSETCYRLDKKIYGYELAVDLYEYLPSIVGHRRAYLVNYDHLFDDALMSFFDRHVSNIEFKILKPSYGFIGRDPPLVYLPNAKQIEYQPIIQRSSLGNYNEIVGYGFSLTLEDQTVTPIFKRPIVFFEKANDWMLLKLSIAPDVV